MMTNLQKPAIRKDLMAFDHEEQALLKTTIAKGTTDEQFNLFIQVCKQTGLNPFARQIYAVVRNVKSKDKYGNDIWVPDMSIQTSIDGYRLLAQRSNEYQGQDGPYFLDGKTKQWLEYWVEDYPPVAARVGVMRKGFQKYLYAVARFESYAVHEYNKETRKKDGPLSGMWGKMPEVMIAKVAEALALRRAFPAELSGVYTKEEMDQADMPLPEVQITPVLPQEESEEPIQHVEGEVVNVSSSTPARSTDENTTEQYIPTETELKLAMKNAGYSSMYEAIRDLCVGTGKSARAMMETINNNGFNPDIVQFLYNRIQAKKQEQQQQAS